MRFNTAISKLMEMSNTLIALDQRPSRAAVETFVLLLAPFAPHICEELWCMLGHKTSLSMPRGRHSMKLWLKTSVANTLFKLMVSCVTKCSPLPVCLPTRF